MDKPTEAAQQAIEEAAAQAEEARARLTLLLAESRELRAAVVDGDVGLRAAVMAVYELPQLLSLLAMGLLLGPDSVAVSPEATLALLCAFRLRTTGIACAKEQPALSAVFAHAEVAAGPVLPLVRTGLNY